MNKNSMRKTVVVAIVAIFMSGSFVPVVGSENRNISTSQPFEESERIEMNGADLKNNLSQSINKTSRSNNDSFIDEANVNQSEVEPAPRNDSKVKKAPIISDPKPANGSAGISLLPPLTVTVDDLNDDTLTASWYSNSSGSLVLFATNFGIDTSTGPVDIVQTNANFSSYSTTYWWSVHLFDGFYWTNETHHFTTKQPPGGRSVPVIYSENPPGGSTDVNTSPILQVTVDDADDDTLTASWYSNSSGSLVLFATNFGIDTSTGPVDIVQTNANFSSYSTTYWWSVHVFDGSSWANETYSFTTQPIPWWNDSWFFRKKISIDYNMVEENLTNFPVLISLDSDSNLSSHARLNGNDIVFIDANGKKLNHEIELFNHTAGKLIAWVNVTNLSSITNTTLYLYYGNPSCGNQESVSGVWDSGFVMVQHLNESGDTVFDSTSYVNDGVSFGTVFNESGWVDGGREYTGDDYVAVDDFTHSSGMLTAEAWVYRDNTSNINIFCKGTHWNTCDWILYLRTQYPGQGIDFGINNHASSIKKGTTPENIWFYLTATYDAGYVVLYVNGTEVGNGTIGSSINNNHANLGLGNDNDGGQPWIKGGLLDELRVSRVARNSSWVKTSYNTMNNPSSFFNLGSEEIGVIYERPVVCDVSPLNNSVNVSISLDMLSFNLIDYQGDLMNYSVVTVPNIGVGGGSVVGNDRYSIPVSGLKFNMVYTWFVNVTDPFGSGNWTNMSFSFSTFENAAPVLSDPSPNNQSFGVPLNPVLSISASDIDGDSMNVFFRTNASGSWEIIGSNVSVSDGTFYCDNTSVMNGYLTTYWWSVNATDPTGSERWTNRTYRFTTEVDHVTIPFAQGWQYRKKITIDHNMVDEDIVNFPVLISISDMDVAAHAQPNGDDIIFMDGDGVANQLHHEIEYYNSTDGSLIAWVNVTSLSSDVDTVLYMYYGNPLVVNQENATGVWDNGFVMVQHLNETGDTLLDSTTYSNDGISIGTIFNESGQIDGGREYDGDDYIAVDDFTHSSGMLTAEAWVYRDNTSNINIFCKGTHWNTCDWILYLRNDYPGQGVDFGINNHSSSDRVRGGSTPENTWFYVTATFDAGDVVLYVNGTEVGSGFISSSVNNSFAALGLGNDNDGGQPWIKGGLLDELRVSRVARNSSWVKTSFNTMNSPNIFFSLDPEEVGVITQEPVVCDIYPLNNTVNVSTSLDMLSFDLIDYQGDLMNYSVVTVPDISGGAQSNTSVGNGRYSIPVSGLKFNMVYTWFVNVTDPFGSGNWTNMSFSFSTFENAAPVLSDASPVNQTLGVPLSPVLSVFVSDVDGDGMDVFFRTNASGVWETIGSNVSVSDGTFYCDNTSVMNGYLTTYWWSVNVTDPGGSERWTNRTYRFTTEVGSVTVPFAQGWQYRKKITIDHSMVDEDLVNFPVLIDITDTDLHNHTQSDGDDIIFMDGDGIANQLHHEIEYYNSTDGSLIAWVNVSSLSSDVDTVLYMYYGNSLVVNQENMSGVWDSGFVMVQHLNESGDTVFDSTSYDNDGTSMGTMFNDSGRIDGGREYDDDDYIAVDDFTHSSDGLTAEGWVYRDNTSNINIFCKGTHYNTCDWVLYLRTGSEAEGVDFGINNHSSSSDYVRGGSTPENTWFYLSATYDAGYVVLYVNGSEVASGFISSSINNSYAALGLGNDNDGGQPWIKGGLLDELRVSRVARNSSWVKTSYNTMSFSSSFFSLGSEEVGVVSDAPFVCDVVPLNNSVNVSISLDMLCFDLIDYQGDLMDYTVVTVPDISGGSQSDVGVGNDRYSILVSGLKYNMAYTWFVNVTDPLGSGNWTNMSFTFSTLGNAAPVLSDPSPVNGSEDVSLSPVLSISVSDVDGDGMDVFFRTNASGVWETIGSNVSVSDGTFYCDNTSVMNGYLTTYWWSVNVTDPGGSERWTNRTYCFTTESAPVIVPWWNASWFFRKEITIDHTMVEDNLTNFPVLINLDSDSNLSSHARSNGYDIVFTDVNGSKLSHEIELFNHTTGRLIAWVNVTNLSSITDTSLYMYYGNPLVVNQENATGVWDSGFVMVQHLNETRNTLMDSSLFSNDGVSFGTVFNDSGLIDGGREYTGDDYIAVDDFTHSSDGLTAEAWVYRDNTDYINIFCKGTRYITCDWILYLRTGSETEGIDFGINNHASYIRKASTPENTWFYLTATFDAGDVVLYVNGSEVGNGTIASSINNNHPDLGLGNSNNGGEAWGGLLDELRVSHVARNSSWVKTSFNTMSDPSSFFNLGAEEVGVIYEEPVVCDVFPLNNSVNVSVSLSELCFDLIDYQGDLMNYTVATVPNIGSGGDIGIGNGRYSILVSDLKFNMVYTWFVNVTDGTNWANASFMFSTFENAAPVLSDPSPGNQTLDVPLNPVLSISASDTDEDSMDVFFRTNASGSWETIGTYTDVGDGTFYCDNTSVMNGYLATYWWSVNVTDPTGSEDWVNQTFCFTTEVGLVTIPFAQGWQYRKKITIDHNMVDGDLVNFPVLISISDADLAVHAQFDGDDIIFMDGDGVAVQLHHEIEYYNSSDGSLIAWVNITRLSSVFDTVLYIYYGNPLVKSMENVSGVWNDGYVMVQHLNETGDTILDSTIYSNDGVSIGTTFNESGWVDGGREYDGNDYIAVDDFTHSSDGLTAEGWVYRDNTSYINIFCKGTHYNTCDWVLYLRTGSEAEGVDFGINNHSSSSDYVRGGSTPENMWFYLSATYDAGYVVLYVNGSEVASGFISSSINNSYAALGLGNDNDGGQPWIKGGLLDELRVSCVARNSSWVKTSYNTMNDPSSFFSLGSEEVGVVSDAPFVCDVFPLNNSANVSISLDMLCFDLIDYQGDLMDYTVVTAPDICGGAQSGVDVSNGRYSVPVSGLQFNMAYTWFVNVTDPGGSGSWTNESFTFSTPKGLRVADPSPSNGATDVPLNPTLQATVSNAGGDPVDWWIKTNASGGWEILGNGILLDGNGTISVIPSEMKLFDTMYWWCVNVTNGDEWDNQTYQFTTHSNPQFSIKWHENIGSVLKKVSLVDDLNGDGIKDVVQTSNGVVALNGVNGSVLWQYTDSEIGDTPSLTIADLNNDGIPEIVLGVYHPVGAIAIHGNNGSVYWKITDFLGSSHQSSPVVFDLDRDGYPTCFFATVHEWGGDAELVAVSYDGKIKYRTPISMTSHGGISIMDYDNDGHFEIYLGNRHTELPDEPVSIDSFWAENLTLRWRVFHPIPDYTYSTSSSLITLVDITGDGIKDLLTEINSDTPYGNTVGLAVLSAENGSFMRGITDIISGHRWTYSAPVYDIDLDGNLEWIWKSDQFIVWDLVDWEMDFEMDADNGRWQPTVADVTGDGYMEMVVPFDDSLKIYNKIFIEIASISLPGSGNVIYPSVMDLDNDGFNEIVVSRGNSEVMVIETNGRARFGGARSELKDYSEYRHGVSEYITVLGLKDEWPPRDSVDIVTNLPLFVTITNWQDELMDITFRTNASGIWEDIGSFSGVGDGTYNVSTSIINSLNTRYWWSVNVTDRKNTWTNKTYSFTTASSVPDAPIVINPTPKDGTSNVSVSLSELKFYLADCQGDMMDYAVETSPDIGVEYDTSVSNGTYVLLFDSDLDYDTTYNWYVNATDGVHLTYEVFSFTTEPFDVLSPLIKIEFAGNLSDQGGPYFLPSPSWVEPAPDGYYTDASHQEEDWMYIKAKVVDPGRGSLDSVYVQWLNATTGVWINNTFEMNNIGGDYYEFNTSGNITVISSHVYSFDILASDTAGNEAVQHWFKVGVMGIAVDDRRYVQLAGTPTDISYNPYYLYSASYNHTNGYGPNHHWLIDDMLHHDQGPDGQYFDTGYLLSQLPTDSIEERHCTQYVGYWFDETITALPGTLNNIYLHVWWHTNNDEATFSYGKYDGGFYRDQHWAQSYDTSSDSSRSDVTYLSRTYYLESALMNISSPYSYTDNDIYEFFIELFTPTEEPQKPHVISNRSIMSFVVFNVPDNVTLQGLDTDGDGLNDYQELYGTFTNPFISDTDNDETSDYMEYLFDSDPNSYLDTVVVDVPVLIMESPTHGSSGQPLNPPLSITVLHPSNATMDVTFRTNAPGYWVNIGTNFSVHNGTYSQTPSDIDSKNTIYYWSVNCSDGIFWTNETYWFRTVADCPVVSNPNPADEAINVLVSLTELSFKLSDDQSDLMNYTVETVPDIGGGSGVGVSNGTYTVSVSNLEYDTDYTWYINVTDPLGSGNWTNKTFSFTTHSDAPLVTNPSPSNGAVGVSANPLLSIDVLDFEGDPLTVIFRSNVNGMWEDLCVYTDVDSGTYTYQTENMHNLTTQYWWSVNVTDTGSNKWTNNTYSFMLTSQLLQAKWVASDLPNPHASSVLLADVTGDDIDEVILAGEGGVVVLDGIDGHEIWSRTDTYMDRHVSAQMADLNNDGILEIIAPLQTGVHVFHGNNGTTYWRLTGLSGSCVYSSPVVFDIDGYGYPVIYLPVQDVDRPYEGTLNMISHDGQLLASTFLFRTCRGGLSLADADFDGEFEIYAGDRASAPGGGLRSFWAKDLTTRWDQQDVGTISSQIPMIADVDEDGVLDLIVCNQGYPYQVFVVSALDGSILQSERYTPGHYQPSLYDIDYDGNLEIIVANKYSIYTPNVVVRDLVTLDEDANFFSGYCDTGPKMGDVTGDGYMEMIVVSYDRVYIYNKIFDLLSNTPRLFDHAGADNRLNFAVVNDIDGDGLNEVVIARKGYDAGTGFVYVFDTPAPTPTPRPRSEVEYYSEYRLGAAEYVERPGPKHPMQRDIFPENGSTDVDLNPTLSAHVWDYQWDEFNITFRTNASGMWEDIISYDSISRYPNKTMTGNAWGTYTANITNMNQLNTTYYWSIYAEDVKGNSIEKIYHFTTSDIKPYWDNVIHEPFNFIDPIEITNPVLTANDVTDADIKSVYSPYIFHENRSSVDVTIFEGFEFGYINTSLWNKYQSLMYGRNQRDIAKVRTGSYAWRMDVTCRGNNNLNELYTVYDFSGISNINIDFWQYDANDEETNPPASWVGHRNADAVAFTNDGVTWYKIFGASDLNHNNMWWHFEYNISSHPNFNPNVGSEFAIKFQQYDNYPYSSDGRFWDDINIEFTVSNSDYDEWYMFFTAEESSGDSDICLASSSDGFNWTYRQVVLDESFNVASPLVFRWGDTYYMVVECDLDCVKLYKSEIDEFPYGWTFIADILSDRSFASPSLLYYNHTWWLFVGDGDSSTCWLYYSYDFTDPSSWVEHPSSPISTDKNDARPAGRNIVFDGDRVVRWGMDCNPLFGQNVRAFEIDMLTTTSYAEHEIPGSPILEESGSGWNAYGMHHVDPWWTGERWIAAVDGNGTYDWSIGIYATFFGEDTIPPEIKDVVDTPDPQEAGGHVNISCDVTDNVGVDTVKVNVTGPDGFLPANITVDKWNCYYNNSYSIIGTYHYFIWANDTSGNANTSETYSFDIKTPTVVYVDDDYNDSTPGWQINHFDTINDAIDAVEENGSVYVYNGTYYENVIVDKTINLIGENRNNTIIDGGGSGDVVYSTVDWVNISGFTIKNGTNGIYLFSSSYNNISNNNISSASNYGIYLYSSSNNIIYNNYFSNINNAWDDGNNIWNISKRFGTNIIGGQYLGGNFWSDYTGIDLDGDGIGDTDLPHNCSGDIQNGGDLLPLVESSKIKITDLIYEWNFVSLPFNQTINKEDFIVRYNGTDYNWTQATGDDNPTGGWIILDDIYTWLRDQQGYDFTNILDPGYGYWMYAYYNCTLLVESVEDIADDYITDLSVEWNIVGLPDDEPLSKEDFVINYNGTDYNWTQATGDDNPTGGWIILDDIYTWLRDQQGYDFTNILDPGYGYWMYAYHNCTLLRPVT